MLLGLSIILVGGALIFACVVADIRYGRPLRARRVAEERARKDERERRAERLQSLSGTSRPVGPWQYAWGVISMFVLGYPLGPVVAAVIALIAALRSGLSPAIALIAVTAGYLAGSVVMFGVVILGMGLASDPHLRPWLDRVYGAIAALGPTVTCLVVVAVVVYVFG